MNPALILLRQRGFGLLLALALLFAQHGALQHALRHALASRSAQPVATAQAIDAGAAKDGGACLECLALAALGAAAAAATALPWTATERRFQRPLCRTVTQWCERAAIYLARAPPVVRH